MIVKYLIQLKHLSNAVILRRGLSIIFNRIIILALIYCIIQDIDIVNLSITIINKGLGLHGGLLHITNITQINEIFIYLISILVLELVSFDFIKLKRPKSFFF